MTKNAMVSNLNNDVLFITKRDDGMYAINTGVMMAVRHYEITDISGAVSTITGSIDTSVADGGKLHYEVPNKLIYSTADIAALTNKVANINAKIVDVNNDAKNL